MKKIFILSIAFLVILSCASIPKGSKVSIPKPIREAKELVLKTNQESPEEPGILFVRRNNSEIVAVIVYVPIDKILALGITQGPYTLVLRWYEKENKYLIVLFSGGMAINEKPLTQEEAIVIATKFMEIFNIMPSMDLPKGPKI